MHVTARVTGSAWPRRAPTQHRLRGAIRHQVVPVLRLRPPALQRHRTSPFHAVALVGAVLSVTTPLAAEEVAVPIAVQATLIAKVSAYDRNFTDRAGKLVVTIVVTHADDGESERNAAQMRKELGRLDTIVGLPHTEQTVTFTSGGQLGELVNYPTTRPKSSRRRCSPRGSRPGSPSPRCRGAAAGSRRSRKWSRSCTAGSRLRRRPDSVRRGASTSRSRRWRRTRRAGRARRGPRTRERGRSMRWRVGRVGSSTRTATRVRRARALNPPFESEGPRLLADERPPPNNARGRRRTARRSRGAIASRP